LLQQFLGDHLAPVHKARVAAVFAAVTGLIRGGELGISKLGRAVARRTSVKHGIKRIDRLYGNSHLRRDREPFYRGIAHGVLKGRARPVILVDWTEAGADMCVLAAAVPTSGRAVAIYSEAHPFRKYTNPCVEAVFLRRLRDIIPISCRPIIVTDAGFRAPWLRRVVAMGWDYIGRVRGRAFVRPASGGQWVRFDELYTRARLEATDLGRWAVTRYQPYECRLVTIRKRRRRWVKGERTRALKAGVRREVEAMREPWLLATSLQEMPASAVAVAYAKRMQIEETFRDTKSRRFGWAFEAARTTRAARVDVMMLLAALASLLVLMVGVAAEDADLHRGYQANTTRTRRVLALTTLGRLILLHSLGNSREHELQLPGGLGG
jgi:hypothetical protein